MRDLHKKHGPVARIGPNVLDLDLPELTKTIYNIKGDWVKVVNVLVNIHDKNDNKIYNVRLHSTMEVACWGLIAKLSTIFSVRLVTSSMRVRRDRYRNITL